MPASAVFRSKHDATLETAPRFLLADTPGHGKLRYVALSQLQPLHSSSSSKNIQWVIFVVDGADLASGGDGLRVAAEYLHDVLRLVVQRQRGRKSGWKVLVAANKLDLFTALPAGLVRTVLEAEIEQVRRGRERGLLDSGGVGEGETGGDRDEMLEDGGEGAFRFEQLEGDGVEVTVEDGSVLGSEGGDVQKWWEWIAGQL